MTSAELADAESAVNSLYARAIIAEHALIDARAAAEARGWVIFPGMFDHLERRAGRLACAFEHAYAAALVAKQPNPSFPHWGGSTDATAMDRARREANAINGKWLTAATEADKRKARVEWIAAFERWHRYSDAFHGPPQIRHRVDWVDATTRAARYHIKTMRYSTGEKVDNREPTDRAREAERADAFKAEARAKINPDAPRPRRRRARGRRR